MRWMTLALLAVVGCNAGADGNDTDGSDTAAEDTGVSDTGDTEETALPCETFAVPGTISVPDGAAVPTGAVDVELVFVDFGADLAVGDVFGQAEAPALVAGTTTDFELCVANTPPSSDVFAPDSATPDFRIASYAVRASAADGSWVGASLPDLLVWVEGTIPLEIAAQGVVPGWNRLTLEPGTGDLSAVAFTDTERMDFDAQLLIVQRPALTALLVPDLSSEANLVVGAWNINRFVDNTLAEPANATVGARQVTTATSGARIPLAAFDTPPDDHTVAITGFDYVEAGFYMTAIWSDADSSLSFETTETMHANSTSATPERTLMYLEPTDWRASILPAVGLDMGWNLVEDEVAIRWSEGAVLDAP